MTAEKNPMWRKKPEDYMTPEAIIQKRKRQSEAMKASWAKRKLEQQNFHL